LEKHSLGEELSEEIEKKDRLLIEEIPHMQTLIDNAGSRMRAIEDRLFFIESSVKDMQQFATVEGVTKIKRGTVNYVVSKLREHLGQQGRREIKDTRDLMKAFSLSLKIDRKEE
jgi:hypothetical protein